MGFRNCRICGADVAEDIPVHCAGESEAPPAPSPDPVWSDEETAKLSPDLVEADAESAGEKNEGENAPVTRRISKRRS